MQKNVGGDNAHCNETFHVRSWWGLSDSQSPMRMIHYGEDWLRVQSPDPHPQQFKHWVATDIARDSNWTSYV